MTATEQVSDAPIPSIVESSRHIPQLDILRGIAILAVFSFHALFFAFQHEPQSYNSNSWIDLSWMTTWSARVLFPFSYGLAGVPIFFVLSGFVIHLAHVSRPVQSTADFYLRRFWRIYPPYLVALIIFSAIMLRKVPNGDRALQFGSHLFMLHNLSMTTFYRINPAFWSLATEVQFYFLYPLLLLAFQRFGMKRVFFALSAVAFAIRIVLIVLLSQGVEVGPDLWRSTPVLWPDWILGVCIAHHYVRGRCFLPRSIWFGAGLCAATFISPLNEYSLLFFLVIV